MIEFLNLNGKSQCVSIKANKKGLPLLLYVHGGPGDAALPLVSKYNKALEDYYTVVVWEQRGAGKSYYPFDEKTNIHIEDFIKDMEQLCQILLERYQQDGIYLVGHSWGSILGLKFAAMYPQYLHRYIGCGQVVNMMKSSACALEYAIQKNIENKNQKVVNRLKTVDCRYTGDGWIDDLLFVTKQVVKYGGSLYGKKNYNTFIIEFLISREYTLADLIKRQKGSYQSIQFLWQELMKVNFEENTNFDVPVTFIEGKYDAHVSSELAAGYYKTITTPKNLYLFEQSAHFPQWSEAEKFNKILIGMVNN